MIYNSEKYINYRFASSVYGEILCKISDIEDIVDYSLHSESDVVEFTDIPLITDIVDVFSKYMAISATSRLPTTQGDDTSNPADNYALRVAMIDQMVCFAITGQLSIPPNIIEDIPDQVDNISPDLELPSSEIIIYNKLANLDIITAKILEFLTINSSSSPTLSEEDHSAPKQELYVFRKVGDSWTVVFDGVKKEGIRGGVGFLTMQFLLSHPNKEYSVFELEDAMICIEGGDAKPNRPAFEKMNETTKSQLREIKKSIIKLEAEKERLSPLRDHIKINELIAGIKRLKMIRNMTGYKGSPKDTEYALFVNKARINYAKRINSVTETLDKHKMNLAAEHFRQYVKTGYILCYMSNIKWVTI